MTDELLNWVHSWYFQSVLLRRNYSVPLFDKEGLGEILLDKSPSVPLFSKGEVNTYVAALVKLL